MKNKLFILICFIFMFGFSMNVLAAPASNPVDVPYYFEMNDEGRKLAEGICGQSGYGNCQFYFGSKQKWELEFDYTDSDIQYFTFASGDYMNPKFDGFTEAKEKIKQMLTSVNCGNKTCYKYFSLNYCGNGKETFTKNFDVCNELKTIENQSLNEFSVKKCSTTFDLVSKNKEYGNVTLFFTHDTSKTDDINVSFTDPNVRENIFTNKYSKDLNDFYFYPKGSNWSSFKGDFLKKWTDSNFACDSSLGKFCLGWKEGDNQYSWYFELDASECENVDKYNPLMSQGVGDDAKGVEYNVEYKDYTGELLVDTPWKSLSCSDIIPEGSKTQELLKTIINMIKIAVPVLLLVFGVIDFGSAIFAQEEGNIKKAQGKFIKRLIIAVIIFLIPSILNVILSIAHTVWPNISPDFCGIL